MNGTEATGVSTVRRSILSLGAVNALDMVLQAALPMLLVRMLSESDFGVYRTLWLIIATAVGVLPLGFTTSLFYYLPRSEGRERAAYTMHAAWILVGMSVLGALGTWLWCRHLGVEADAGLKMALFVLCWVFGSILDSIYNAQQRGTRQAGVNLLFALLRFGLIVAVAAATHSIEAVLTAHVALGVLKALACSGAVVETAGTGGWKVLDRAAFAEQSRYALPFGVSQGFYMLRLRIDQWLVAALFSSAQFGLYSVASVFSPIQGLIRATINNVVLPELNRLQAGDDIPSMLALNRRGNLAVAMLMFPVLAFLFTACEPLLLTLFTPEYLGASAVVRIYCVALLLESIEVTMLMYAFRQGDYLVRLNAVVLVINLVTSWVGALVFGLPGAAIGGVVGVLVAQGACFVRAGRLTGRRFVEIQPWGLLLRIFVAAAVAAVAAALCLGQLGEGIGGLLRIAISGVVLAVVYWLAVRALGLRMVAREVLGARLARLLAL